MRHRWLSWWRSNEREQDLERELRSDLELEEEELKERGVSAAEAKYAASRAFGNVGLVKENARRAWGGQWIEDLSNDLRYTLRYLRKSPGFTAVAVLSLAVGLGANAAIFTIINAVLLKSLPVRDPQGLVVLGPGRGSGSGTGIPRSGSFSLYSYDLYKQLEGTKVFGELGAAQSTTQTDVSIRRHGWSQPRLAQARLVSGNYFEVLGIAAALGRMMRPPDDSAAAPPVAVISFQYWKSALASDPSVIGSTVNVGRASFTVIGVAPAGFYGETLRPDPPSLWLPLSADRQLNRELALIDKRDEHWLYLIGRLAPNVSVAQAQSRLGTTLRSWLTSLEGAKASDEQRRRIATSHIEILPGGSGITHMKRDYAFTFRLLLGISVAVLLITCANIASLLLARGVARSAETSLRLALGASRWRLIRQLLTESLTLALIAGAIALATASAGTKLLVALFFRGTGYVPIETSPDFRVLAFTFLLSCAAGITFGLLPAFRMSSDIAPAVKGASPAVKGSRLSRRGLGIGSWLIATEIALSLIVLTAAGAFVRSLTNISEQQFGFNPERVLIVKVDTQHSGYDQSRLSSLYSRMYAQLNALPGVKSASFSYYSPFNGCCWGFTVSVQGNTPKPREEDHALLNRVSGGYFETLNTRVLRGRTFDESDLQGSRGVAVVNDEFVRRYLGGKNPIGSRFGIGGQPHAGDLEVVGVVENAKYDSPRDENMPMAFLPFQLERANASVTDDESNFVSAIEVRTAGQPRMMTAAIRRVLSEIDPGLPVLRVTTLSDDIALMLNQENVVATLAGFFGLLALLLSCLGLYGLMAYSVQRRTSEIGTRMALGADRLSVVGMMLREAFVQGLLGIAMGIPIAFAVVHLLANKLYAVSPTDPRFSLGAALILVVSMLAAAFLPSLRAAGVDPMHALRHE